MKIVLGRSRLMIAMVAIVLVIFTLTRIGFTAISVDVADLSAISLPEVFFKGLFYDLAYLSYAVIPAVLYMTLMPERFWHRPWHKIVLHLFCFSVLYLYLFTALAEWLFWQEFNVRFNFISVDYLVYRREVMNNIQESYPIPLLLSIIFVIALILYASCFKLILATLHAREPFMSRMAKLAGHISLAAVVFIIADQPGRSWSANVAQNELGSNGLYQFFAAFRNNELDYSAFYPTMATEQLGKTLRQEVAQEGSTFLSDNPVSILRDVKNPGPEHHYNIMLVMVESLSADFLAEFGSTEGSGITPRLDALSGESLFFSNFYATGNRTVRGLEAVTLSIPPTPGSAIVKRIGKEGGLWSLGNVLREKGYDTKFIYGGRGYFDNMAAFFSSNGYDIIDQSTVPNEKIHFSNAWGMSDEDTFQQALDAADQAHANGKPFFYHIMTTSNHRPYTFPGNRIDIPSGSGRKGAVKYTDWAIGNLLEKAKSAPWFDDTIFVIVADHTASSAGKVDLPVKRYHIPLWIYAPKHITAQRVDHMSSQIDLAPTLLALLGMDYRSSFFGKNILTMKPQDERALIATYQSIGIVAKDHLLYFSPPRKATEQDHIMDQTPHTVSIADNDPLFQRNVAYYEGAYIVYHDHLNAWPAGNRIIASGH